MTKFILSVAAAPPVKDGARSIFNPQHPDHGKVLALQAAMSTALAYREPFEGVPLRLDVRVSRAACKADGLNLINGIADVIQRRTHYGYTKDVWLIDDDAYIQEFHYSERLADSDGYELIVSELNPCSSG